jgi:hypothetical protein
MMKFKIVCGEAKSEQEEGLQYAPKIGRASNHASGGTCCKSKVARYNQSMICIQAIADATQAWNPPVEEECWSYLIFETSDLLFQTNGMAATFLVANLWLQCTKAQHDLIFKQLLMLNNLRCCRRLMKQFF